MSARATRSALAVAVLLALATGCGTGSSSGGPLPRPSVTASFSPTRSLATVSRPTASGPTRPSRRRRRPRPRRPPPQRAQSPRRPRQLGAEHRTDPGRPTGTPTTHSPHRGGLVGGHRVRGHRALRVRGAGGPRRLDGRRRQRRLVVAAARRAGRRGRGHGAAGTPCTQQAGLDRRPRGGRARGRLARARPRARAPELGVVRGCQWWLDRGVPTSPGAGGPPHPARGDGARRRQPCSGHRLPGSRPHRARADGRAPGRRRDRAVVPRAREVQTPCWPCWSRPNEPRRLTPARGTRSPAA